MEGCGMSIVYLPQMETTYEDAVLIINHLQAQIDAIREKSKAAHPSNTDTAPRESIADAIKRKLGID